MEQTTIKLYSDTKAQLDLLREYPNETYDAVLKKMLYVMNNLKKKPRLSAKTMDSIDAARERMRKGEYYTSEEARKRLGL